VNVIVLEDREPRALEGIQHSAFPEILAIVGAGCRNLWVTGPAGTGKSTIAAQVADALDHEFLSFSAGPADMPSRLIGFRDGNGTYHSTPIRKAVEQGERPKLLLIDEGDNMNAACFTTLNALLAGGAMEFPDGTCLTRPSNLTVMVGANTWGTGPDREYVGRSQIDAATLNRFPVKLPVGYDPRLDDAVAMQWCRSDEQVALLKSWVAYCQRVRATTQELHIKVIISPRNIGDGAALLAAGFSPERVAELVMFGDVEDDVRAKIDPGTSLIAA
jgi:MoxR-like ATPase